MAKEIKMFKFGSQEDYEKLYKLEAQKLATIGYAKRVKTILGSPVKAFAGTPIERALEEAFEGDIVDKNMTLDEARVMMLMKQMFKMGPTGLKAIELSYRIDGTFDNKEINIDLDEIENQTEGIE